ncbi:MAG TPA: hypothetical protein VMX38_17630 [Verrucomicrobiae bacterium]|nr:hypothetical protein [Verrucomicrobiae bacterium]
MAAARHEPSYPAAKEPSVFSLLSGWAQQGAQTLFATQRILIDLAMRQNASVMHAVRQQLSDPHRSPTAILSEVAGDGMSTFVEGQKVFLELARQQHKLLITGVKERMGDVPAAHAVAELLQRSVDNFIEMHEEYLKIAGKQAHAWVEAAKSGRPYQPERLVDLTRESLENFVKAQKRFLDIVAEETGKAASGKPVNGSRKAKPTALKEVAQQATESLIEAQKRLIDVTGRQIHANVKSLDKTLGMIPPFPFLPVGELTREVVKSYVDAQKALMEVMVKAPIAVKTQRAARRPGRQQKAATAVA